MTLSKRIALGLVALPALLLAGYVAAEVWARSQIQSYRAVLARDLADERVRVEGVKPPVVPGPPIEGNAAPIYEQVWEQMRDWDDLTNDMAKKMEAALDRGATEPLPADVARLVAGHTAALDRVRLAVRHTRCDWEVAYEKGIEARRLPFIDAQRLALMLLVTGHQRAAAGDPGGAARRYLETMRFGHDVAQHAMYMSTVVGASIERSAAGALGQLVTMFQPGAPYLPPELVARLPELERLLPDPARATARERLLNGYWFVNTSQSLPALQPYLLDKTLAKRGKGVYGLLPVSVLFAHGLWQVDTLSREAERAISLPEAARGKALEAMLQGARRASWNPLVGVGLRYAGARKGIDAALAQYRLARAAVQVEREAKGGRYPKAPARLPEDPFAPAQPLRYAPAGSGLGYRLWSVGLDGKDNKGMPVEGKPDDELILERAG